MAPAPISASYLSTAASRDSGAGRAWLAVAPRSGSLHYRRQAAPRSQPSLVRLGPGPDLVPGSDSTVALPNALSQVATGRAWRAPPGTEARHCGTDGAAAHGGAATRRSAEASVFALMA